MSTPKSNSVSFFEFFKNNSLSSYALFAALLLGLLFVMPQGWIPHDEGLAASLAERVLRGERPHIDFIDTYSGGLTYLHALAFRAFGLNLISLRIVLLIFFLPCVAVYRGILLRFCGEQAANGLTVFTVFATLPLYFAPVPSWYNLFFAIWTLWALVKFYETRLSRWLFLSGIFVGASILVKIVGIYSLVGAIFWLLFLERTSCPPSTQKSSAFLVLKGVALACAFVLFIYILRDHLGGAEALHFLLPLACVIGFLGWDERRFGSGNLLLRGGRVSRLLGVFLGGATLPILTFCLLYPSKAEIQHLLVGVLILPQLRAQWAYMPLPPALSIVCALPLILLLSSAVSRRHDFLKRAAICSATPMGLVGLYYGKIGVTAGLFLCLYQTAPLLVVLGIFCLAFNCSEKSRSFHDLALFLFLAFSAPLQFTQYPYFAPMYFYYTSPIFLLAGVALCCRANFPLQRSFRWTLCLFGAFHLVLIYGAVFLTENFQPRSNFRYSLSTPRSGLKLTAKDIDRYQPVLNLVEQHSGDSRYIYAGPDMPEVYFLTGKLSPLRAPYEFFDVEADREHRLLELLVRYQVNVIVLNTRPGFSSSYTSETAEALRRRYSCQKLLGQIEIRWRCDDQSTQIPPHST